MPAMLVQGLSPHMTIHRIMKDCARGIGKKVVIGVSVPPNEVGACLMLYLMDQVRRVSQEDKRNLPYIVECMDALLRSAN
jgi:hypothetical protein